MTKEELLIFSSFVAAFEVAIAHLAKTLERHELISCTELAAGYREAAEMFPAETINRDVYTTVLGQLAKIIESTGSATPPAEPAPYLRLLKGAGLTHLEPD